MMEKEKNGKVDSIMIQELCANFDGQSETKEIFENYILDCENRFKQGTLEKEEIPTIKDVVELTGKYQDIVFYLKVCKEFGQEEEARKFVNSQVYDATFTEGEEEGIEETKGTTIEKLCADFDGQSSTKKIFRRYILDCEDKFKQRTLKKGEIATIKDVVELTDKYQDVVFYLKVCIRFGQVGEAKKFVNSQIHNEAFTREEQDKLRGLKEKIQQIEKKYIAIGILKKGEGVKKATEHSGLPKTIVEELNLHLLQKAQENRKRDKNDDGEEQNI